MVVDVRIAAEQERGLARTPGDISLEAVVGVADARHDGDRTFLIGRHPELQLPVLESDRAADRDDVGHQRLIEAFDHERQLAVGIVVQKTAQLGGGQHVLDVQPFDEMGVRAGIVEEIEIFSFGVGADETESDGEQIVDRLMVLLDGQSGIDVDGALAVIPVREGERHQFDARQVPLQVALALLDILTQTPGVFLVGLQPALGPEPLLVAGEMVARAVSVERNAGMEAVAPVQLDVPAAALHHVREIIPAQEEFVLAVLLVHRHEHHRLEAVLPQDGIAVLHAVDPPVVEGDEDGLGRQAALAPEEASEVPRVDGGVTFLLDHLHVFAEGPGRGVRDIARGELV